MNIIEISGLKKVFRNDIKAVDGISLEVREAEIFGLLGPNGAGKTTTIRMLATMTRPTSGNIRLCGYDVSKEPDSVRRCIGIVFQDPALDDQLTGRENLDFHARMYGMPKKDREERIREVLSLVELSDRAGDLVEKYSGGMKRRLEIARGLMHRPRVLFLDEPTLGLDTQTRRTIWKHIIKLNREYKITIILTTHYMEEADFLCKRVAIIDKGKILALDTPASLKDILGGDVITFDVSDKSKMTRLAKSVKGLIKVRTHGNMVSMSVAGGGKKIPSLLKMAENSGVKVNAVDLHRPTLEDVFIHFTGKSIRAHEASSNERLRNHMRARMRR